MLLFYLNMYNWEYGVRGGANPSRPLPPEDIPPRRCKTEDQPSSPGNAHAAGAEPPGVIKKFYFFRKFLCNMGFIYLFKAYFWVACNIL
jgi:hypothetical protein